MIHILLRNTIYVLCKKILHYHCLLYTHLSLSTDNSAYFTDGDTQTLSPEITINNMNMNMNILVYGSFSTTYVCVGVSVQVLGMSLIKQLLKVVNFS